MCKGHHSGAPESELDRFREALQKRCVVLVSPLSIVSYRALLGPDDPLPPRTESVPDRQAIFRRRNRVGRAAGWTRPTSCRGQVRYYLLFFVRLFDLS